MGVDKIFYKLFSFNKTAYKVGSLKILPCISLKYVSKSVATFSRITENDSRKYFQAFLPNILQSSSMNSWLHLINPSQR